MTDPQFPDRPDHPDFRRMSAEVLKLDGSADARDPDNEDDVVAQIGAAADPHSVVYMSQQRIKMSMDRLAEEKPEGLHPTGLAMAAWIDGFILGVMFERAGGKRRKKEGVSDD